MVVKSRIYQARKNAGLTQSDLAQAAGISRQAYTAIEAGKSVPSTEVALRLARKLTVSVEQLFWLDEDSPDEIISAELEVERDEVSDGSPMQLVRFGSRLTTRPLRFGAFVSHSINPADAIALPGGAGGQIDLKLLSRAATEMQTVILAGCDPSTSILASMMRDAGVRLIWIESESMPALHALARGEIHVAGCNFREKVTGVYNAPLVKEVVPFPCTVVRFAVWRQGLILSPGNPKAVKHIDDLARSNVTFINRMPGAGSRGLLNRLLREAGVPFNNVHGYDKVASGHLATAETVASGLVDCGISIEAAARANFLDFLPLNEEPYDLVIPNHLLDLPPIQRLLDTLHSRDLRRQVESLGGYDTSSMGVTCG